MKLYALQYPDGRIEPFTLGESKESCWFESFPYVAGREGHDWERKYWKRLGPSKTDATKKGYKIIPVKVIAA